MTHSNAIPIVDVEPLFRRDDPRSMQRVLREIRHFSREIGLFYLTGHRISPVLLRAVYLCSMHFFSLPEEFKNKLSTMADGNRYIAERQYVFAGAKMAAAEEFYPCGRSRLFPAGSPKRHPAIDKAARKFTSGSATGLVELYYREIFSLCRSLLEGCALADGGPADLFQCLYQHPVLHAQLLTSTPSTSNPVDHDGAIHQSFGGITILWDDDVRRVKITNSATAVAKSTAVEGRFALRIADMMARLSNDLLISAPHRVVDIAGKEAFCIPVFYDKTDDASIECVAGCLVADRPRYLSLVA